MGLCEYMEITLGVHVGMRWWDQVGTYLVEDRERLEVAADVDEDGRENLRGGRRKNPSPP